MLDNNSFGWCIIAVTFQSPMSDSNQCFAITKDCRHVELWLYISHKKAST